MTYADAWGVDPLDPQVHQTLDGMEQELTAEPEVVDALATYRACVAKEGYDWSTTEDVFRQYQLREAELTGELAEQDVTDDEEARRMEEFNAEKYAAFDVHDACLAAYDKVVEDVRGELIEERLGGS